MITDYQSLIDNRKVFFDCTVGVGGDYPSLKSAIEDGKKRILVISNITENQPITISHNDAIIVVGNNSNSIIFNSFISNPSEKKIHFHNLSLAFNNLTINDNEFKLFIYYCLIILNTSSIRARQSFIVNSKISSNNLFANSIHGTIIASSINALGYFGNVINSHVTSSQAYFGNINGSFISVGDLRLGRVYQMGRNAECKNNILSCSNIIFEYNVLFENNTVTINNSIENFITTEAIIRNNYFIISSSSLKFSNSGNYNDIFSESIIENNRFNFTNGGTLRIVDGVSDTKISNNVIVNGNLELNVTRCIIENNRISGNIINSTLNYSKLSNNTISSNNSNFNSINNSIVENNKFNGNLSINGVKETKFIGNYIDLLNISLSTSSFFKNNNLADIFNFGTIDKTIISENICDDIIVSNQDPESIITNNITS